MRRIIKAIIVTENFMYFCLFIGTITKYITGWKTTQYFIDIGITIALIGNTYIIHRMNKKA